LPEHTFEKKVQNGTKTTIENGIKVKKIVLKSFVTLVIGDHKFRKKITFGKRESGQYR